MIGLVADELCLKLIWRTVSWGCVLSPSAAASTSSSLWGWRQAQLVPEALFFVSIHTADHLRAFHWNFCDSFTAVLQLAVVATLVEHIWTKIFHT